MVIGDIKNAAIGAGGHITKQPTLCLVSRQVCSEVLPIFTDHVCRRAKTITFRIHDFDFSDAMIFLSALSVKQMRALDAPGRPCVHVSLVMTLECVNRQHDLLKWLRFCGDKSVSYGLYNFDNYCYWHLSSVRNQADFMSVWNTSVEEMMGERRSSMREYIHHRAAVRGTWNAIRLGWKAIR